MLAKKYIMVFQMHYEDRQTFAVYFNQNHKDLKHTKSDMFEVIGLFDSRWFGHIDKDSVYVTFDTERMTMSYKNYRKERMNFLCEVQRWAQAHGYGVKFTSSLD